MNIVLLLVALSILAVLAFYAGSLLFKLRTQEQLRNKKTQKRIDNITQSIQTIAKALDQQQCNLSEGCIRLFHLLEALPVKNKPDFSQQFTGLYSLYEQVKELPTHEFRKAQTKRETKQQDLQREELEAQLETQILKDVTVLKNFAI
ncbi:MAG: type II secretory pathway component PulJ [Flavobacteriales bacterium]|jgi:type II secretory pathway component PulJ